MTTITYFKEKPDEISYFEAISIGFEAVVDELAKK